MFKPRRPEHLLLVVAAYIVAVLNVPFWRLAYRSVGPDSYDDWLFLGSAAIAITLAFYIVLLLFSLKPVVRVLLALLLPVTAAASYFMSQYGIVIDDNMVRNVFQTDSRETGDLITSGLAAQVMLFGVVPAVLFYMWPWTDQPFRKEIQGKAKAGIISALIVVAVVFPFWGSYLSLVRDARDLRLTLTPFNYISAASKYVRRTFGSGPVVVAQAGLDAKRIMEIDERPHVMVIAVGETARADHFGLNGYERQTTPELAKVQGVINYPNASSCGTDTAQSVPCMFSDLRREGFTNEAAAGRENLLDILKRSGADVIWRENQSGCKGVCARVTLEDLTQVESKAFYEQNVTFDDALVDGLAERLANVKRDTIIVLHMMGSHGPAYWKRYPPAFEVFKPVCMHSLFSQCESAHIVNAYDNTILYTDHVLARLIGVLSKVAENKIDTGMIYLSDHGESLGENNIYLHGMPYAIAPKAQTHIPMLTWLSPGMKADNGIEPGCLESQANEPVSHDNLFHSVLGIMDIATKEYDPKLDLYARCTRHPS